MSVPSDDRVTRYRVEFDVGIPNQIPIDEHVALAIGLTAAPDFLPDRVYRQDGDKWVRVYDEAGT